MTTRIALIGSSHAAAFKTAWDEVSGSYPGIEITFFAARNQGQVEIGLLKAKGGKLVAEHPRLIEGLQISSQGLSAVDPALYDAFLLVGFPPRTILLPPASPYSAAVRAAMYETAQTATPLAAMMRKIRKVAPEMPVFAAAQPLVASGPDAAEPDAEIYAASAREMTAQVHAPLGVTYLPQPLQTIRANQWTDPAYSRGSVRLQNRKGKKTEAHPSDDRRHMNAAYGKLALAEALATIEADLARG